jgi:SET domain-containing protein
VCKLNHSCNPNCEVTFEAATGAGVVLKALRPIKPEEELTISYVNAEAAEPHCGTTCFAASATSARPTARNPSQPPLRATARCPRSRRLDRWT